MSRDQIQGDRRKTQRYEGAMELRFQRQDPDGTMHVGHGTTVDLSRGGLRFNSEEAVAPGMELALQVVWPVLLQNICPLELFVKGTVSAVTQRGTILLIRRYEFRTCGARSFWEEPVPAPSISKVA